MSAPDCILRAAVEATVALDPAPAVPTTHREAAQAHLRACIAHAAVAGACGTDDPARAISLEASLGHAQAALMHERGDVAGAAEAAWRAVGVGLNLSKKNTL